MTTTTRPTPTDLTMHTMTQTRPGLSLMVGAILHLDGTAPPIAGLRAHVDGQLHRLPRLTHYVKGPGLQARWAHDPHPALEPRIRERQIEAGQESLDAALQDLLTHPLPADGPLWDLWLLHGHTPGRYTLCYRAHHTSHDGAGLLNTLYNLFGTTPVSTVAAPVSKAGPSAYARVLKATLASCASNNLWNDPAHPLLNQRVSSWAHIPTDHLRIAGASRGGSSNDALLAALAGALGTWSTTHWPRAAGKPVPALVMVDLRRTEEEQERPGNLFTFFPVTLRCQQPAWADRLDAVTAAMRGPRTPAQRTAMRTIMNHMPARLFHTLASRLTTPSRAIVDTSYVAIRHPLRYQDAPVTHVQLFTWLPYTHPVSLVACSYNGTTSVNFVTDAALPDLHQLPALWKESAQELLRYARTSQ